jgi:hypothetical protein
LIARIAKFLNLLTFEDTPNYDKLRRLFKEIGELAGEFDYSPSNRQRDFKT